MKVTITLEDHLVPMQLLGKPCPIAVEIIQQKTGYRDDRDISTAFNTADTVAAALHVLTGPEGEKFAAITMTLYQQAMAEAAKQEVPSVQSPRIPRTIN